MSAIGFHSGANNWSNTVTWDSPGALNAVNIGNDIFEVQLDPLVYYGLSQMPTNIGVVYNQGVSNPGQPWDSEGKCQDFFIYPDSLNSLSNPISVSWDMSIDGVPFSPTTSDYYVLTATNNAGCSSYDSLQIVVIPEIINDTKFNSVIVQSGMG